MNKNLIALAVGASVALPGVVNAAKVAGDALEVYGKAHISVDSVSAKDNSTGPTKDASNLSVSSNSSRLGFKGQAPVGSMTGFYKIEGSISFADSGGQIDHRAAYAGLKSGWGGLLLGYRDTPYKDVRGKFDVFGDTVGDARNIIGSVDSSNLVDKRAKNAIMYTTPKIGGFEANIMYSTAWEGNTTAQAGQDNNNNSLIGANIIYNMNALMLAAAMVQQNYVDAAGETSHKATGTRLLGAYEIGNMRVGLIYENLDDDKDVNKNKRRSAYGANFVFKTGPGKAKIQYLQAGDNDAVSNSGATEIAVGYDFKLAKNSTTYVAYSQVNNDTNASYVMNNGHDQKYTTVAGEKVSAFSVGYIYSF